MANLNAEEVQVLLAIKDGATLQEIGERIRKSTTWADKVVNRLKESGMVEQPVARKARRRNLTTEAVRYLRENGLWTGN